VPVSVVVGGQYGSEGKGKVALDIVRCDPNVRFAVRPGGTNSGHTGYSRDGKRVVLRQLPAAAIDGNVCAVLPAGSYIDVALLFREMALVGLPASHLLIDPRAHIIRQDHVEWEKRAGLPQTIGSTGSGTGAAVLSRVARCSPSLPHATFASEVPELLPFLRETVSVLDGALRRGDRAVIEGTQGFGLSPVHGDAWPKCTSRDTTAASFVAEAGLSPLEVDQVILVLRSHPIRVAGDSGPLLNETTWASIAARAGAPIELAELTSVTQKLRRVALFDASIVRRAIAVNRPTQIVLNHLDHVDWAAQFGVSRKALQFIGEVEREIGQTITGAGVGPLGVLPLQELANG
jgi:adenylosuccinate synthase